MPQLELAELEQLLTAADKAYYDNDDPIVSDVIYDELVREYYTRTGIKWMKLGKPSEILVSVEHSTPMLSLDKITTITELQKWINANDDYVLVPKIDGLSCTLVYHEGNLIKALTRGDGRTGESILHSLGSIIEAGYIPAVLKEGYSLEVRGELFIPADLFSKVGGANPRNSAAGLVRRIDRDPRQAHLRFLAYRTVVQHPAAGTKYSSMLEALMELGFQVPVFNRRSGLNLLTLSQLDSIHPNILFGDLSYEVDGLVITHDSRDRWVELGETNKYPRWAKACKFEDETAETTILAVEWNASRTGVIVPTYVFEAVQLEGTTVTRATGHNLEQFLRVGASVGDRVLVKKANQIIPQVVRKVS